MLLTEDKLKQFIREEAKKYLENLETQHHPYRILLMSDVPVLFPEGYEEEAINTYNIMMERRVELPDFKVVGHLDIGILDRTNSNLKVMDIKTCASYKWRMKFGRNPDKKGNPNYNMQLATYLEALDRELGVDGTVEMSLLWYNKDTSALREEHVDISWIDKAMEYWEELNEYSDSTTSDDMVVGSYGVPMENWECRYCGFKDIYCKGV